MRMKLKGITVHLYCVNFKTCVKREQDVFNLVKFIKKRLGMCCKNFSTIFQNIHQYSEEKKVLQHQSGHCLEDFLRQSCFIKGHLCTRKTVQWSNNDANSQLLLTVTAGGHNDGLDLYFLSFLWQGQPRGLVHVCGQFKRWLRSNHRPPDTRHLVHRATVHSGLLVLHERLHSRIAAGKKI